MRKKLIFKVECRENRYRGVLKMFKAIRFGCFFIVFCFLAIFVRSKIISSLTYIVENGFIEKKFTARGFVLKNQYLMNNLNDGVFFLVNEGERICKNKCIASCIETVKYRACDKKMDRSKNRKYNWRRNAKESAEKFDFSYNKMNNWREKTNIEKKTDGCCAGINRNFEVLKFCEARSKAQTKTNYQQDVSNEIFKLIGSIYKKDVSQILQTKENIYKYIYRNVEFGSDLIDLNDNNQNKDAVSKCGAEQAKKMLAPASGIFTKFIDEDEKILSNVDLSQITPVFVSRLEDNFIHKDEFATNKFQSSTHGIPICKVIDNCEWKFVANVDLENLSLLSEGDVVKIQVHDVSCEPVLGKILKISGAEDKKCAIVISSLFLTDFMYNISRATVDVIIGNVEGLKVPKKSVVWENGRMGVLVKQNKTLKFRTIDILSEDENYFVVEEKTSLNGLKLYDEIVLDRS
ncbi:MAG: hypothetical protein LBJ09_00270 [Clostridiales bacterium]|jgi:putative membrane fusion protein|nr:hypothetical protein [Clostridiales bacterium]